jgi:hypothetical protein
MKNRITKRTIQQKTEIINKKKLTKSEIQIMKMFFEKAERPYFNDSYTQADHDNVWVLRSKMKNKFIKGYSITKEQTEIGLEYLNKFMIKKRTGTLTKPAIDSGMTEAHLTVFKNFHKFMFVGYLENMSWNGLSHMTPIYRVISKSGEFFDYSPGHWSLPVVFEVNDSNNGIKEDYTLQYRVDEKRHEKESRREKHDKAFSNVVQNVIQLN